MDGKFIERQRQKIPAVMKSAADAEAARQAHAKSQKADETSSTATDGMTVKTSTAQSPYPDSYPDLNPVDFYRAHIAEQLAPIAGVDAKDVYTRLQWTQTLDKGDLTLPVPALRVKGKKPQELAEEWGQKVCLPLACIDKSHH